MNQRKYKTDIERLKIKILNDPRIVDGNITDLWEQLDNLESNINEVLQK